LRTEEKKHCLPLDRERKKGGKGGGVAIFRLLERLRKKGGIQKRKKKEGILSQMEDDAASWRGEGKKGEVLSFQRRGGWGKIGPILRKRGRTLDFSYKEEKEGGTLHTSTI